MCSQCETKPYGVCGCGCGKAKGRQGCTAHSKATKGLCAAPKMRTKHVCRSHGGLSLTGPESPSWKHGKFSKGLPARFYEDFQQSLLDPEQINLFRELALVDTAAAEVIKGFSHGEAGSVWRSLRSRWPDLVDQVEKVKKRAKALDNAVANIGELIATGASDAQVWRDLWPLVEQRRKLASEQIKIDVAQGRSMPAAQVVHLIESVLAAARAYIPDPRQRAAFGRMIRAETRGGAAARRQFDSLQSGDETEG